MKKIKTRKQTIKRIDENGNTFTYANLQDAANAVDSKVEKWKIQLFIAQAMISKGRAFKSKWMPIEN